MELLQGICMERASSTFAGKTVNWRCSPGLQASLSPSAAVFQLQPSNFLTQRACVHACTRSAAVELAHVSPGIGIFQSFLQLSHVEKNMLGGIKYPQAKNSLLNC